jgi:hypothetical protein
MGEWMYRSTLSWLRHLLLSGQFTPLPLYPRRKSPPCPHCIGGWIDPRTGLDDLEKRKFLILPGLELRPLGRPARSQSLYRLRYHGSLKTGRWIMSRKSIILLIHHHHTLLDLICNFSLNVNSGRYCELDRVVVSTSVFFYQKDKFSNLVPGNLRFC